MITLIANSGIQFVDRKINLTETSPSLKSSFNYYEHTYQYDGREWADFFSVHYDSTRERYVLKGRDPEMSTFDCLIPEAVDPETWQVIDELKIAERNVTIGDSVIKNVLLEEKVMTMSARKAIELFEGEWLPLPYFKKHQGSGQLFMGPVNWARMWFTRIPTAEATSEHTHNIALAFDTNVVSEEVNAANHVALSDLDVNGNVEFKVPTDDYHLSYFTDSMVEGLSWVERWLETVFLRKKVLKPTDTDKFRHVAAYITLIKAFGMTGAFPDITIFSNNRSIELDLIMDIGNSRTCGILVETDRPGDPFKFEQAFPLHLRDLTSPDKLYHDTFDMRVAFRRCTFGDEAANVSSGNPKAFHWPSMVRLGKEATRLSVIHDGTANNATMSSPKRYLWDTGKRLFHWNYIGENQNDAALKGISKLFDEGGVFHKRYPEGKEFINAQNAYYSRSSVMTFALIEIFLQALTQANSHAFRERQGSPTIPRKLRRITLTCPTAMMEWEKRILREHAEDAIAALKESFSEKFIDVQLEIIPGTRDLSHNSGSRRNWGFDEASCSQFAFLYGEVAYRFKNKASLFFETMGKRRANSHIENVPSVMIASVDIGGGTTDLMICEYQDSPETPTTRIVPNPRFWEGFNVAGDAIIKSVVERAVMPAIREAAKAKGVSDLFGSMNFLFGNDMGQLNASDRFYKRQFANEIAYPLALGILQHASENRISGKKQFADFFIDFPRPTSHVLRHVNQTFEKYGAWKFNLEELEWTLDTSGINQIVKDTVEPMILDLCKVIAQFNPDFILLAGRPTMLPVVREMFVRFLPISPDRLISLGGYEIGNWYPFANERGVIRDPKTCVAVGATVALMGGTLGRLGGFSIDTELLREKFESTADYIGALDPGAFRVKEPYLTPHLDEAEIKFAGPSLFGVRQMNYADWLASPIYKITWSNNEAAQKYLHAVPFTVRLQRNPKDKEGIKIIGVLTDRNGQNAPSSILKLSLQTIPDESGHWLDTGCFSVDRTK